MKNFRNIFFCTVLLLSTSCITKYLWGDQSYEEQIYQVFVGQDGRYVVLVSPEYHYVFTDSSGLMREILSLKQENVITMNRRKSFFKLSNNNDVNGEIFLEGPFDLLAREEAIRLHTLGVLPDSKDNLAVKIKLNGRRYAARYIGQTANKTPLGIKRITIYYRGDSSPAKDAGKVAITPIAVTLDAVLLIGKVVLYDPYKFFNKAKD